MSRIAQITGMKKRSTAEDRPRTLLPRHSEGVSPFGSDLGALRFLRALVQSSTYAITGKSLNGEVVFWNAAAEHLYGYTSDEIMGRNVAVLVPPDRSEELADILRQVRAGTAVEGLLTERVRKDGTRIPVLVTCAPIRDSGGTLVGASTITHDMLEVSDYLDELRRLELSSSELEGILETVKSGIPVGLGVVDREFRMVHINAPLAGVSGGPPESLIGKTVAEIVPAIWPQVEATYRHVLEKDEAVLNLEVESKGRDGMHHLLASYYPVHAHDEVIGVGLIVVDITDRWRAEAARGDMLRGIVNTLAATSEVRDPYTAGHQRRVATLARAIADELGTDPSDADGIQVAATIHDIGKISVPTDILVKPGRLSPPEWEMVKEHARCGYEMVSSIPFPWPVADMILQHHERMDGSGYPAGRRGGEILLGARIIGVADTVEAMSSHRPYRPALGTDAAIAEIVRGRGTQYDSAVVDAVLELRDTGRLHLGDGGTGPDVRPARDQVDSSSRSRSAYSGVSTS